MAEVKHNEWTLEHDTTLSWEITPYIKRQKKNIVSGFSINPFKQVRNETTLIYSLSCFLLLLQDKKN